MARSTTPPSISRLTARRRIAFGWYGGKFSHLEWLLPLLPPPSSASAPDSPPPSSASAPDSPPPSSASAPDSPPPSSASAFDSRECHHYCEPFAGSAAVLLNRPPSPLETYNDLDGEVANFFRVLRDHKRRLTQAIALTPFSREEFAAACLLDPRLPALERARRFYVRARQVRTGLAQSATLGRWANCKQTSRAGMSGVVSRWLGGVELLPEIAERLLRVQIENRPAVDVIRSYDSPRTLFYCDPPYVHVTRGDPRAYSGEMTDQQHVELAEVLNSATGMVAISNYDCDLMNRLYPAPRWRKVVGAYRTIHSTKTRREEVLWTNYTTP